MCVNLNEYELLARFRVVGHNTDYEIIPLHLNTRYAKFRSSKTSQWNAKPEWPDGNLNANQRITLNDKSRQYLTSDLLHSFCKRQKDNKLKSSSEKKKTFNKLKSSSKTKMTSKSKQKTLLHYLGNGILEYFFHFSLIKPYSRHCW